MFLHERAGGRMDRILSTNIYKSQALTPVLLSEISRAGMSGVEILCDSFHFGYGSAQSIREMASALNEYGLTLHSLHAPTERDKTSGRGSGVTISIADPERIRRQDAVDEMKRALEVAEMIPFRFFALDLATG